MNRVEVVVRFAGDLLDVVQVPAGATVWIGAEAVIASAGREATFGHVTVSVTPLVKAEAALARRPIEQRPYIYGAASLLAQLAIVLTALWSATSDPISAPAVQGNSQQQAGATRIKRFAVPAQTIKQVPEPAPSETPVTSDHTPEHEIERDKPPPAQVTEFVPSEMTGGGLADGPKDGDGTSRFDPSTDPAFDTIKVGDYSTVASGRTAGDEYGAHARNSNLVVITCDRASCLVIGGEKAARIRKAVQERQAELTDCYKQAAESGGGSVEIDFDVDGRGAVKDLSIGEADPAGTCVARILRTLKVEDGTAADA